MTARLLTLTGLFALAVFATTAAADDEKKENTKDPEVAFKKLDTDKDGKLTKEEFKKITDLLEGVKKKLTAAMVEEAFTKLDTDKDDKLSLDEFKKVTDLLTKKKKKNDK